MGFGKWLRATAPLLLKGPFVRRFRLPSAIAALALLASALETLPVAAAPSAHVLRFATAEEVATLNPDLNQQLVVVWLDQMTSASLFRLDAHNALIPELATVVPTQANGGISKDGKTITLHLRKGVKWSDGQPFDGDDVAFSIAAVNNPANQIVARSGFDQITKVDQPDKFTVAVHLKAPFGAMVYTLFASNQNPQVLPKHILGGLHDINTAPFNSLPVGIGPFRYKAWKRGDEIRLEANPYYWRGKPALSEVVLKLIPDRNTVVVQLQTGELDMFYPFGGVYLPKVQAIPNIHIIRQPSYALNEILFNTTDPLFKDATVRRALRMSIDRRELRDKVGHGVGVLQNVLLPTVDPLVPKDIAFTEFDLAKANAMLDGAGWKRGGDGVREKNGRRLSIDVASSQGTPDADIQIELVRAWFKQVGAELNVQRYQSSVLFGPYGEGGILATGKFGMMFLGNLVSAPFDLENSFGCKGIPPAGQNYNRLCDPAIEPAIAKYQASYDFATRKKLLAEILRKLDDEAVAIPTVGREDLFGLNPAIKNFHPNNATPFDDMMRVDVLP